MVKRERLIVYGLLAVLTVALAWQWWGYSKAERAAMLKDEEIAELEREGKEVERERQTRLDRLKRDLARQEKRHDREMRRLATLPHQIKRQTPEEDIETLKTLVDRPDLPDPVIRSGGFFLPAAMMKGIEVRLAERGELISENAILGARLRAAMERENILEETVNDQATLLEAQTARAEAWRKAARKGKFRRILNHPAVKMGVFAAGIYVGSNL